MSSHKRIELTLSGNVSENFKNFELIIVSNLTAEI